MRRALLVLALVSCSNPPPATSPGVVEIPSAVPASPVASATPTSTSTSTPTESAIPAASASAAPISSGRLATTPSIRMGALTVSGRLPPEVIQRIVRQNFGRFRLCYENGLRTDPKLQGRVTVKFVIDTAGAVRTASDGGSDLPDQGVISCVVRGFGNLSFPQPEGGEVTVVYPIIFAPGGN